MRAIIPDDDAIAVVVEPLVQVVNLRFWIEISNYELCGMKNLTDRWIE
jgi:hypothetical protein